MSEPANELAAPYCSVWLTDINQIPTASIESLERSLITSDGRGKELKRAVLDELKRRLSTPNDQVEARRE